MHMENTHILSFFKKTGYKLTSTRKAIAKYVETKKGIFCAHDLISELSSLDRVSIYRTIELFEKLDIVHPVLVLDGQQYYEAHSNAQGHHHHAICTKCHKSECISCDVEEKPVPGFKETHHMMAVTGLCYKCH